MEALKLEGNCFNGQTVVFRRRLLAEALHGMLEGLSYWIGC